MAKQFDLINTDVNSCYAITQGITYDILTFYYKDLDLTTLNGGYTPTGEIRDNFVDQSGNILATFSFQPLIFGSVTVNGDTFNATTIQPFLTATDTAAIARPGLALDGGIPILGLNAWVYDIKLMAASGGDVKQLGFGFAEILPDVTTR